MRLPALIAAARRRKTHAAARRGGHARFHVSAVVCLILRLTARTLQACGHARHHQGADVGSGRFAGLPDHSRQHLPLGRSARYARCSRQRAILLARLLSSIFSLAGTDLIDDLGGLHKFMNWKRCVLCVSLSLCASGG